MKLTRSPGLLLVVAGGFLMLIDTLLAWQSVTVSNETYSRNAWHGTVGLVLGLLAIVFFGNAITYAKIVETSLRLPHRHIAIVVAPAILVFALIKNIDDRNSAWASYVGIVLAALITWGAWMLWSERPPAEAQGPAPAPTTSASPPEPPTKSG